MTWWRKAQTGLATLGWWPQPNLLGDRQVEWSWVAAHLGQGPGTALDFGSGQSALGLLAARRGYEVTALDLLPARRLHVHSRLTDRQGDVLLWDAPSAGFDLIINCSTIEHVGLSGRYGVAHDEPDADLAAMARLRGLLKPAGRMLLTLPVGQDAVFAPLHRVYGAARLPRLLTGWRTDSSEYWAKDAQNRWVLVPAQDALAWPAVAWCYALGLFVLIPEGR